jgi:hypothetical protein
MSFQKKSYNTIVSQAKKNVVGFSASYQKFLERVTIEQNSMSFQKKSYCPFIIGANGWRLLAVFC